MREIRPWVAQQQFDWKKMLDWTRCRCCSVSNANILLDLHAWGCLLKCSSEQVRKATDAEWLGAELSKTLATELLKSRQRSGQRGYVDVETEGQPTEEPPADTRPDVNQILRAALLFLQHQACSRRFLRKVNPRIPRCQKKQDRVQEYDRVSQ